MPLSMAVELARLNPLGAGALRLGGFQAGRVCSHSFPERAQVSSTGKPAHC